MNCHINPCFVLKRGKGFVCKFLCFQHLKALMRASLKTEYQAVQQSHIKLYKMKQNQHRGY